MPDNNEAHGALIAKIEAANRKFFPETYNQTRFMENSANHATSSMSDEYANVIGICRAMSRDKQLEARDRIAAMAVYRQGLRDVIELGIFDEGED